MFQSLNDNFFTHEQMNDSNTIVSKNLIDYYINPFNIAKLKKLDRQEYRKILPFLSRFG